MFFLDTHIEFFEVLLKNKVQFLLIGGYTVIAHGYNRTTGDIDLWLNSSDENKLKFIDALTELEFDEDSLNYLSTIDFTEAQAFSFGENPCRIDFLTKINQVDFDEAYAEHLKFELGNITLPIIQLKHLILSKNNTGRIKDAADIEELQRISRTKNE